MASIALVVENDESTRKLLDVVLARTGYEVDAVANGTDAKVLLGSVGYDLVLIDLMVPGASGLEILEWLAAEQPETIPRALVLSSAPKQHLEHVRDCFPQVRLIRKPFELQELIEVATAARRDRELKLTPADSFARRSIVAGAKAGVLVRRSGQDIALVHKFGYAANVAERWFPLSANAPLPLCQCLQDGRPRWVHSLAAAPEFPQLKPVWQENQSRAMAALPLTRNGVVLGAAGWTFREPRAFDEREQLAFTSIAEEAAATLDPLQSTDQPGA